MTNQAGKGMRPKKGYNHKAYWENYDAVFRKPKAPVIMCRCGCEREASYLISGTDYGGDVFKDDPACYDAMKYCEESALELDLPFSKREIK